MTATLQIRAVPNGKRAEIVGRYGDAWKVRVTAAPEKGRANQELVKLLSQKLGLPRDAIEVVRGQSTRDKVVAVRGLQHAEAERRLTIAIQ